MSFLRYTTRDTRCEKKLCAILKIVVGSRRSRTTLGRASDGACVTLQKDSTMAKGNNAQGKDKKKAKAKAPAKSAKKAAPKKK